jgi:hypothetical protein
MPSAGSNATNYTAGQSPLDRSRLDGSRRFGASTRIGRGTSPKHAAAAIIEDQKATHRRAGMTISPLRIGHYEHSRTNVSVSSEFQKLVRDKYA